MPQDQVIDDDEPDTCPLCIEELDLSDRGFRPCPCGYQICQFCYNNIKTTMNGLCPACRRTYDDKNIKFDAPSTEEVARYKENKAHADKKRQAAKRQEAASRQADSLSRKHLAGIRVRRQNLVYVTGLRLNTSDPTLSDKLRGDQFFGQYGKIDKIVVNKPKDSRAMQPVGVYITYFDKDAAALCINVVNNSQNAGGTIRADYGTTKYCSAFLRHETCTNKNCTFLHEVGDDNESFTREGLSSLNAFSSQSNQESSSEVNQPVEQQPPQPHHFPAISESLERSELKITTQPVTQPTGDIPPPPGLPATAAWGRPGVSSAQISQAPTPAAASPVTSNTIPATTAIQTAPVPPETAPATLPSEASHHEALPLPSTKPPFHVDVRSIRKLLATASITFDIDNSIYSEEQQKLQRLCPPLWDTDDGMNRYAAKQRAAEQRRLEKDHEVASQALSGMHTEDAPESGSLQLGGEPEERQDLNARRQNLALQPSSDIMSPTYSSISHVLSPQAQTPALSGRGSVPQQQFLPHQFKSPSPGFPQQNQSGQASMYSNTHQRQTSRFGFGNDGTGSKTGPNSRFTNQDSAMGPPSSSYGSQYFPSGVQGPPPGLKATGTPPVSGGGMFGQGHGFATASLGYGINSANRSANDDMMRELLRNRGGSAGSGQTSEGGRREFKFPSSIHQYPSSTRSPGLSSFPYGSTSGAFQDHGQQKQKKKGKKHRHANTSSSGGGVVDLADPSILQSRMHQSGTSHQGHYGAQGQGQDDPTTFQPFDDNFSRTSNDTFAAFSGGLFGTPSDRSIPALPPGLSNGSFQPRSGKPQLFAPGPRPTGDEVPSMRGLGEVFKPVQARRDRPIVTDESTGTPKDTTPAIPATRLESELQTAEAKNNLDETSFPALPKPSSVESSIEQQKKPSVAAPKAVILPSKKGVTPKARSASRQEETPLQPTQTSAGKEVEGPAEPDTKAGSKSLERRQPGKLDIEAATKSLGSSVKAAAPSPSRPVSPSSEVKEIAKASTVPARTEQPNPAPAAPTSAKASSAPRTLRVTSNTKPQPTASPSRSPSAATQIKPGKGPSSRSRPSSRRPSVTSTATEKPSIDFPDSASNTTEAISRANSPPPSSTRVGSAPVRSKTKSQAKKERQERSKVGTDDQATPEPTSAQPEPVEVAPVLGRMTKKTKSKKQAGTRTSTPDISRPPSPMSAKEPAQPSTRKVEDVKEQDEPAELMSPKEIPIKDKPDTPIWETLAQAKAPEPESPSASAIIKELQKSGELEPDFEKQFFDSGFKAASGRQDPLTVDDIWSMATPKTLTPDEVTALNRGEAVRREGPNNKASSRLMISPAKKCLPRLTKELEDRYLELERRVTVSKPPYKYTHQRGSEAKNLMTIDDMLRDMTAILTRPPKTSAKQVPVAPTNPIPSGPSAGSDTPNASKTQRDESSSDSSKPQIQPMPQPGYASDALAYLNQYILPPLPSQPRPNPLKPQTAAPANAPAASTHPPAPAPGQAVPRTYTTGDPTYSVSGVGGAYPTTSYAAPAPATSQYNSSVEKASTHPTSPTPANTQQPSPDIQKLIHGDFAKITQSDIKKLRKEDIDRLSPADISQLAQNAANAAAAAVGDLRNLPSFSPSSSSGNANASNMSTIADFAGLRSSDFEKIQTLGTKALKNQPLTGGDMKTLRSLGIGGSTGNGTGEGSADAIKNALAKAVNGVVQAAAAVANVSASGQGHAEASVQTSPQTAQTGQQQPTQPRTELQLHAKISPVVEQRPSQQPPPQQLAMPPPVTYGPNGPMSPPIHQQPPMPGSLDTTSHLQPPAPPPRRVLSENEVQQALEEAKRQTARYQKQMAEAVRKNRRAAGFV